MSSDVQRENTHVCDPFVKRLLFVTAFLLAIATFARLSVFSAPHIGKMCSTTFYV